MTLLSGLAAMRLSLRAGVYHSTTRKERFDPGIFNVVGQAALPVRGYRTGCLACPLNTGQARLPVLRGARRVAKLLRRLGMESSHGERPVFVPVIIRLGKGAPGVARALAALVGVEAE